MRHVVIAGLLYGLLIGFLWAVKMPVLIAFFLLPIYWIALAGGAALPFLLEGGGLCGHGWCDPSPWGWMIGSVAWCCALGVFFAGMKKASASLKRHRGG